MPDLARLVCLLVDDHTLFAEGFCLLLSRLAPAVETTVASSCEQALSLLEGSLRPNLVLFDLSLPGKGGLQAFELLQQHAPGVPIVAVSADDRPRVMAELLRAGARGYIPKSTSAEVTLSALRLVLAGGSYVPESALGEARPERAESPLTAREQQVFRLLAQGRNNQQIAEQLGMASSTVRVHVTSILRRLGVTSRVQAVTSPLAATLLGKADSGSGRDS
jgi:DNA-binding NarL/FixJ family response regulator